MSSTRYEKITGSDVSDTEDGPSQSTHYASHSAYSVPNSPPPSFHSRSSSLSPLKSHESDPLIEPTNIQTSQDSSTRSLNDRAFESLPNTDSNTAVQDNSNIVLNSSNCTIEHHGNRDLSPESLCDVRSGGMDTYSTTGCPGNGSDRALSPDPLDGNFASSSSSAFLHSHQYKESANKSSVNNPCSGSSGDGSDWEVNDGQSFNLSQSTAEASAASVQNIVSRPNDGVFANLSAKLSRDETDDEKPPSYEQAAADATPSYWETAILVPGIVPDEVFVDGIPVGSVFFFVWNALISMSFQIIGFLLTYLLHTTHAAKNGSRAGLGVTLIQYGFVLKGSNDDETKEDGHDFVDTSQSSKGGGGAKLSGSPTSGSSMDGSSNDFSLGITTVTLNDWLAYALMAAGWFILIRSVTQFLRVKRQKQLILQSPERNRGVQPVVAEGDPSESVV